MRNELTDQIKCLRDSAREILADDGDVADKITEAGNSIMEIAATFEMLIERLSAVTR